MSGPARIPSQGPTPGTPSIGGAPHAIERTIGGHTYVLALIKQFPNISPQSAIKIIREMNDFLAQKPSLENLMNRINDWTRELNHPEAHKIALFTVRFLNLREVSPEWKKFMSTLKKVDENLLRKLLRHHDPATMDQGALISIAIQVMKKDPIKAQELADKIQFQAPERAALAEFQRRSVSLGA